MSLLPNKVITGVQALKAGRPTMRREAGHRPARRACMPHGVGDGEGVGIRVAGAPNVQGCATVGVPAAGPGPLRLVFPITVDVLVAPPTVAPTAGMPVVETLVAVEPPGVVAAVVLSGAGTVETPGLQGPATVLMVVPTLLLTVFGNAPTTFCGVLGKEPLVAPGVVVERTPGLVCVGGVTPGCIWAIAEPVRMIANTMRFFTGPRCDPGSGD
jgi:hypothetical protein